MLKNNILFISILLGFAFNSKAQELDCRIQVNSSQVQGTNKSVFEALQKDLFEFINNRNWTNNVFGTEERIECNILINITDARGVDDFKGTLQINSSRPVYNSGYKTPMLNIRDKNIHFRYAEGQTLDFNENTHEELTSLIAYYIYIVIGFDYDSFGLLSGSKYFEKAEKIVTTAQSSPYAGWKAFEEKNNRYWLVENLMDNTYSPLREYSYKYHIKGLDKMSKNATDARSNIANGLTNLLKVHRQKPSSYVMQIFWIAKSDEIVKILSESNSTENVRAANILKEIDPANNTKYDKINKKN